MIEEETTIKLDLLALREVIEGKDSDLLAGFYAEEAELRIVHASVPDGLALELKGRSQIERYLRAVCDQEITCLLDGEAVLGDGSLAFEQVCEYPDGTTISVRTTLEVAEGLIGRQIDVVEGRP
jgi:hypothetical protein